MGVQFPHIREVALAGFSPGDDPDPNTRTPTGGSVFKLRNRNPQGNQFLVGNSVFLDFRDVNDVMVPGAKADWQTWFRDDLSLVWTNAEVTPKSEHLEAWTTKDMRDAVCFVQIRQVYDLGAAVKVTIRMAEIWDA